MQEHQQHFIEFLLKNKALQFGEFTLKSGRLSPYFLNLGIFNTGSSLLQLGKFYACALLQSTLPYDMLFGPAYKGIPLVSATAIALSHYHQQDVPYCFNRKESKDHGERGLIVGAPMAGRVIMIDDVITAGTTVRETVALMTSFNAELTGVLIAFDRQERGQGTQSAIQEAAKYCGAPIQSIISLEDLIHYLSATKTLNKWLQPIERYQQEYGV